MVCRTGSWQRARVEAGGDVNLGPDLTERGRSRKLCARGYAMTFLRSGLLAMIAALALFASPAPVAAQEETAIGYWDGWVQWNGEGPINGVTWQLNANNSLVVHTDPQEFGYWFEVGDYVEMLYPCRRPVHLHYRARQAGAVISGTATRTKVIPPRSRCAAASQARRPATPAMEHQLSLPLNANRRTKVWSPRAQAYNAAFGGCCGCGGLWAAAFLLTAARRRTGAGRRAVGSSGDDVNLLPYHRFEINSPLKRQDALAAIAAHVEAPRWFRFGWPSSANDKRLRAR